MSPYLGFWQEIPRPIVGLSPMDGVTDFACRYIMARHGGPDLLVTEFVPIDGILHAPERVLKDFEYHEIANYSAISHFVRRCEQQLSL